MPIKLVMLCFYMFYMFFSKLENSSFLRNSKFTDYSQSTPTIYMLVLLHFISWQTQMRAVILVFGADLIAGLVYILRVNLGL